MHYIKILKNCVSDGPGIRVSLYVSGCRNHCAECHNPQSWNFNFGYEFNENTIRDILESLSRPYIKGLTLCGGDPLEPENQKALLPLVKEIRQKLPDKDIWCYTGYEWEQIKGFEILKYIDVAIVGPFIKELRDITLNNIWRGSRNQRLIDVQSSLKQNTKIFVKNIINNE